jgi:hypothetical protein
MPHRLDAPLDTKHDRPPLASRVARLAAPLRGLTVLATVFACLADASLAQTLLFEFEGSSNRDLFGGALDAADIDNDGVTDLIIGAAWDDAAGLSQGRVVVRSGADGSVVHEWFGDGEGDVLGALVAAVGDVNSDGYVDVLVGEPGWEAPGGFSNEGRARVFSGRSGAVIRTHEGLPMHEEFGSRGGAVGDVDGDGVGDYGLGDYWIWDEFWPTPFNGDLVLVSGATGTPLPTLPVNGGDDLVPAGDVDGDGSNDWLLTRFEFDWDHTQAQLREGAGETVLDSETTDNGVTAAGAVADLTGDGLPEYAFAWGEWSGGQTLEVRGVAGTHLTYELDLAETTSHGRITAIDGRADLNGDGVADLLLGLPASDHGGENAGEVRILSGVDGSELLRVDGDTERAELGDRVVSLGDLDGDGCSDWAVAAPARNAFNPGLPGVVRVYSGGALGWEDHGDGLAGTLGEPVLEGSGFLKAGTPTTLALSNGAPLAPTAFVAGVVHLAAPIKGGILGPSPDLVVFGLTTDGAGLLDVTSPWPALPPATTVWFQEWVQDAGAPKGWAASNTVSATNAP